MINWIKANKMSLMGLIGLVIYYVDDVFQLCERLNIPSGVNFGLATILFLIIGNSIKGKGIEKIDLQLKITKKPDENEEEIDKLDSS